MCVNVSLHMALDRRYGLPNVLLVAVFGQLLHFQLSQTSSDTSLICGSKLLPSRSFHFPLSPTCMPLDLACPAACLSSMPCKSHQSIFIEMPFLPSFLRRPPLCPGYPKKPVYICYRLVILQEPNLIKAKPCF